MYIITDKELSFLIKLCTIFTITLNSTKYSNTSTCQSSSEHRPLLNTGQKTPEITNICITARYLDQHGKKIVTERVQEPPRKMLPLKLLIFCLKRELERNRVPKKAEIKCMPKRMSCIPKEHSISSLFLLPNI